MSELSRRKGDHIDAVLSGEVGAPGLAGGFDAVRFEPCALPELDLAEIDLSTRFLGAELALPFLISSMTGGPERAERINAVLAEAAQAAGAALAVGSQRVAIADGAARGLDRSLRDRAPDILLLGNVGAAQLVAGFTLDDLKRAVEMIGADAMIIHFNPVQEALQAGGDTDWRGVLAAVEQACAGLPVPVVAKEVGFGVSAPVARRLVEAGVAAIDVAGAGGTSWSAVEGRLAADPVLKRRAELFRDWGLPTPQALAEVRAALPDTPLIGSGGVRHGLDAAKALRLGADLVGQAGPLLKAATEGAEAVLAHLAELEGALRLACFATGSRDIAALKRARLAAPGFAPPHG